MELTVLKANGPFVLPRPPAAKRRYSRGRKGSRHRSVSDQALDGEHSDLVTPIVPELDWAFLVKARHSAIYAFYATPLSYLLTRLGTKRIVLAGQVTEQCILYSALDAYVRHFEVTVASDAVAHIDADLGVAALRMMESNMRASVIPAFDCLH